LERSAFSLPPHMNEPILTVAAERTSQLLPNHRFYAQHIVRSIQHIDTDEQKKLSPHVSNYKACQPCSTYT
jgi:hypothetical protein